MPLARLVSSFGGRGLPLGPPGIGEGPHRQRRAYQRRLRARLWLLFSDLHSRSPVPQRLLRAIPMLF
eukprot:9334237-Alexandrium_andersonii.AAC.1